MCGIAGIYNLKRKPINKDDIKKMCDIMYHRGPDDAGYVLFNVKDGNLKDEGYWQELRDVEFDVSSKNVFRNHGCNMALGHRRLSIIDLTEAAHQPMSNRTNFIWITYNGEIYNFKELRGDLEKCGHCFFSSSDTEVIIHLYEEYGVDCINQLNGIFAFAIWDGRKNQMVLARDRYGAKPLYYTTQNDNLIFASEIKAIMQANGVSVHLNESAVADYFTFQNTFGDVTLFDNIKLLEPGHFLVVKQDVIKKTKYQDLMPKAINGDNTDIDYVMKFNNIFSDVIDRQLVADVPIGSYLSGGMDSASISALASQRLSRLKTFTGGFDTSLVTGFESAFDERADAELLSSKLQTEHYQMVMHAGDLEWVMPKLIYHLEDLRMGMTYPSYYIAQLSSKFVKVALGGVGGDEILAGYPWRYVIVRDCLEDEDFKQKYFNYWSSRLVSDTEKEHFFSKAFSARLNGHKPIDSFDKIFDTYESSFQTQTENNIRKALYFEVKTFLHGLLVVEDKISMAHSLELRVPMLDNELVDYSLSLPVSMLINDGFAQSKGGSDVNRIGKYIFRKAMESILPQSIVEKRKQGFSAPDQSWYRTKLVDYIRSLILGEQALDRGYFNKAYVEKMFEDHMTGKANNRLLLWSLMCFEWWNRVFIDEYKIKQPICDTRNN
ncbi:MAG: Asparagine synthetase [glutamine-hydrolyzing] 1 [Candidatus Scalindua arabica]|uniref:asparagine synthase (glutamine-hydrolyzing) n=1 Tax=Candidatus Scalindua arabica TaxID=1127984 RepID=A0A941W3X7_9BACT|nr:Asparagine synthetase [glutamine-hydrolyzing] 1 [Candidatus Scalindua arabica]